jgi:hypothetical protein
MTSADQVVNDFRRVPEKPVIPTRSSCPRPRAASPYLRRACRAPNIRRRRPKLPHADPMTTDQQRRNTCLQDIMRHLAAVL